MKFKLEIVCDNAAFEPCASYEVARILRELSDEIDANPGNWWNISDINGNTVGECKFIGRKVTA